MLVSRVGYASIQGGLYPGWVISRVGYIQGGLYPGWVILVSRVGYASI